MLIDINCDLGESFGVYVYGSDPEMMPLITSANIACGAHGGDPTVMRTSVELALAHDVAIGAHVGLDDRNGFGRREIPTTPQQAYDLCLYQIGALDAFLRVVGARMQHVKLHGALYMMANNEHELAEGVCRAVSAWDPGLLLYVLPGSELQRCAEEHGLRAVTELFADRPYIGHDVRMYKRSADLIGDTAAVVGRTLALLAQFGRSAIGSVCLHSDTPGAPEMLRALRFALSDEGCSFAPPRDAAWMEYFTNTKNTASIQKRIS